MLHNVTGILKSSLRGGLTFQKLKKEKQERRYKPSLAN
jgi:hypothetical protein